jgi:hypothetical protein
MEDVVDALAGTGYPLGIAQIALDELETTGKMLEVFTSAGFEVIEAADGVAAFDEGFGDPGADEAGAASDEIASHCLQS